MQTDRLRPLIAEALGGQQFREHGGNVNRGRYISWLMESTPSPVRDWLDERVLLRNLERTFDQDVSCRRDLEWAEEYRKNCPVAGAGAEDYMLREVELEQDVYVLAGIHFFGGDVNRPFVGVYAQTGALTFMEMKEASPYLCDAFEVFRPERVWWWFAGEHMRNDDVSSGDQRLLVAPVGTVICAGRRLPQREVVLRRDREGTTYGAYCEILEEFLAANPRWRGRLQRTEHEDYLQCAAEGGLYIVEHEQRVAGVMAARKGKIRGIPGWEVVEEILGEELRGRGLAPLVQASFIARLPAASHDLVLGTVDAENRPSLRTALRSGRIDGGGWWFISAGGRPTTRWS